MGILLNKIKEDSKGNIVSYYKENTTNFYHKYLKPDFESVNPDKVSNLVTGKFYFALYYSESNWMQYSPIFYIDSKQFEDQIIGYGINFNFIPLEVRASIFDPLLKNLEDENQIDGITFEAVYKMLIKIGYEYAIVEYDLKRIKQLFHISISALPEFLYSSFPKNKYDPDKLYSIWKKKLETKEKRHQEMIKMMASDITDTHQDISVKYDVLSDHIKRLQRDSKKYG